MTVTLSPHKAPRTGLVALAVGAALLISPFLLNAAASAQDQPQNRPWLDPTLLGAAKTEGKVIAYGSMNEDEALSAFKVFESATGIRVEYVRNSDSQLLGRIMVEDKAGQQSWDVLQTTAVNKLPAALLAQFDPTEAKNLQPQARDPDRRWYGVYANYNSPAYNIEKVKREDLPKTLEGFLDKPEWKGRVAIDYSDNEWLRAVIQHYGDDKGRKLVKDIANTLDVKVTKGHLALARSVGTGEYWVALNNYTNLTLNVKLGNRPTDFWVVEPVAVFYGQVGVNAKAPNPNAARLLSNFVISREGQTLFAKGGRIPTRTDVESNPPGVLKAFEGHKVLPAVMSSEEENKWQKLFKELFAVR